MNHAEIFRRSCLTFCVILVKFLRIAFNILISCLTVECRDVRVGE